jgi:hypothetical protein
MCGSSGLLGTMVRHYAARQRALNPTHYKHNGIEPYPSGLPVKTPHPTYSLQLDRPSNPQ